MKRMSAEPVLQVVSAAGPNEVQTCSGLQFMVKAPALLSQQLATSFALGQNPSVRHMHGMYTCIDTCMAVKHAVRCRVNEDFVTAAYAEVQTCSGLCFMVMTPAFSSQ